MGPGPRTRSGRGRSGAGRFAPGSVLTVPILAVLGALAASMDGFAIPAVAGGAVVGAVWALGLAWVTERIGRPRAAHRSVAIAAFLATVLLGGSTLAMLAYAASFNDADALVGFISEPIAGGFLFFVLLNTAIEWFALPVALHRTWHSPLRRFVVGAALLYYPMRASTYLYFAPAIMTLGATPVDGQAVASLQTWVVLSIPRWFIDVALTVLLVLAARRASSGAVAAEPTLTSS